MGINLQKITKVHFVGIGGIGISAIAHMMLKAGKQVSGSDIAPSEMTELLQQKGAMISIGQSVDDIPKDVDLIVYTNAIKSAHGSFLEELETLKIPLLSYPQMLAIISAQKKTIAIAGTHGKTTTTAMIATILIDAEYDPTVVVGAMLKREGSNVVVGSSEYFVVEADEYRRAFLNLSPTILVINNIDADHLDYYKDLADIQSAFHELALKVPKDGFIICNATHPHIAPVLAGVKATVVDYQKIKHSPLLNFPGRHNVENAKAAISVASVLGILKGDAAGSLMHFLGTTRRFEYKGKTANGVLVYDDYAHNPQKVRAALQGAREKYPTQKIIAVFQPHLFSRTKLLLSEFAKSFTDATETIVLPIYPAREIDDGSISNQDVSIAISKEGGVAQALGFAEAAMYVKTHAQQGDVVITLGAGEAYKVGDTLLQ
jgi:UDP-N-acetylmuramate--alanine ligase